LKGFLNKMEKNKLKKMSAMVGIGLVILMFFIKIIAFYISGSVSVMASLIDSGSDLFTTTITAVAVFTSIKPADRNHRFGHGKAESIGALLQSIFIFISAVFLGYQAIYKALNPHELNIDIYTIAIMIISLCLTIGLVLFQRYVIKKTNSVSIKADNINYTGDIMTTTAVILSLIITKFTGFAYLDSIFALFISFFLFNNCRLLMKEAINILMDREIDMDIKMDIVNIINSHPAVKKYKEFRSRYCGQTYFVEFCIEVDGRRTIQETVEIANDLRNSIRKVKKNMDIIIHKDFYKNG